MTRFTQDFAPFDRGYLIDHHELHKRMADRLADAMHEFNHSNPPRQMYWNGYHQAIVDIQGDVDKLLGEARS